MHPCAAFGAPPAGFVCHSGVCSGLAGQHGRCGPTLAEPELDQSGGCSFAETTGAPLAACAEAAAAACRRAVGCKSFALDPAWGKIPKVKLFADAGRQLTPNTGWNVWVLVAGNVSSDPVSMHRSTQ